MTRVRLNRVYLVKRPECQLQPLVFDLVSCRKAEGLSGIFFVGARWRIAASGFRDDNEGRGAFGMTDARTLLTECLRFALAP
jgi:hypothetical protein